MDRPQEAAASPSPLGLVPPEREAPALATECQGLGSRVVVAGNQPLNRERGVLLRIQVSIPVVPNRLRIGTGQTAQKASDEITSPPAFEPRAHQVAWLTLFLTNFTLPSPISVFTPPEWRLRKVFKPVYWA